MSIPLFITEYYNIKSFCEPSAAGVDLAIARMVNNLTEAIIKRNRLPKYLIVIPDRDIINDVDLSNKNAVKTIQQITRWFVRQLDTIIRQRRVDFLDKHPGAVAGFTTKIIFVRMVRRIGFFNENSKMASICRARPKFNDALNDSCAKINQFMLTIASCNAYEHFDKGGVLSRLGKKEFWLELDEVMDRFDKDRIKLLLNPKNPPKRRYPKAQVAHYNHFDRPNDAPFHKSRYY